MKNIFCRLYSCSIIVILLVITGSLCAQNKSFKVKEIPYPLEFMNEPASFVINDSLIQISANGKTNLFSDPNEMYRVQNAPMCLFEPKGDFTLSAKATGDLKDIYDVAALVVYNNEDLWAKFCYENSVEKIPTMVSVVTRTYSDDCNSIPAGSFAYMSIVKKGKEFSFFYSADNIKWQLIRHFRLELSGPLKVGFASHGSRGNGFTAMFTDIKYSDEALDNMYKK